MEETQTKNKTNLSNIPGGFSIIPNALIGFISDKACSVFLKIYQCQFVSDYEEYDGQTWAKLSTPYLEASLERSRNTIITALDELTGLGMIKCRVKNRKSTFYAIDWKEITHICDMLCKVDRTGRQKLHELCFRSKNERNGDIRVNFERMSNIDPDSVNDIITQYSNATMFVQKMNEKSEIRSNFEPIVDVRSKNERKKAGSFKNCTKMESYDEPLPIQSEFDPTTSEDQNTFVQNMNEKTDVRSKNERKSDGFVHFLTTDIYNINNKKRSSERSSQYKGEKDKKLFEFFSSRDLSLPGFDKTLCESFLQDDIDENDDDIIKSIKQVWSQLGYDEELPENNYIDLATFQNILFHSWQQLKEDYPDYSLSEQDFKNIFGFLIVEHNGEDCLYVDPSKLQDISAHALEDDQKPSRNTQYSDRTSRRLFIECIGEIANKDDKLLTSSEFVALLLMDYAEDYQTGSYPVEMPKLAYNNLLSDFSKQSDVPVEDIKALFKELPQKGKVKISPQQLSPDKFFQYNSDHHQDSAVEKLFKTKLAEQE